MPPNRPLPKDILAGESGQFTVDASVLAEGLHLSESELRAEMRAGKVFSTVERGEGDDEGRYRLTFRYGTRHFCILVEPDGTAYEVIAPMDLVMGQSVNIH